MTSSYFKKLTDSLKKAVKKEVAQEQERYLSFSRNYYLVTKDEKQYITREPLTMLQLLPALLRAGMENDRSIELVERKDAISVLSELKKERQQIEEKEAADLKIKEEKAAKRKKQAEERKRKADLRKKEKEDKKKEQELKKEAPVEAPEKTGTKKVQKEDKDPD